MAPVRGTCVLVGWQVRFSHISVCLLRTPQRHVPRQMDPKSWTCGAACVPCRPWSDRFLSVGTRRLWPTPTLWLMYCGHSSPVSGAGFYFCLQDTTDILGRVCQSVQKRAQLCVWVGVGILNRCYKLSSVCCRSRLGFKTVTKMGGTFLTTVPMKLFVRFLDCLIPLFLPTFSKTLCI